MKYNCTCGFEFGSLAKLETHINLSSCREYSLKHKIVGGNREDNKPTSMNTDKILEERAKTHGSFAHNALVARALFTLAENSTTTHLTDPQWLALNVIFQKIARIMQTPNFKDHWDDIAGYATLVSKELEKGEK